MRERENSFCEGDVNLEAPLSPLDKDILNLFAGSETELNSEQQEDFEEVC